MLRYACYTNISGSQSDPLILSKYKIVLYNIRSRPKNYKCMYLYIRICEVDYLTKVKVQ
jgi:hypothetical protein